MDSSKIKNKSDGNHHSSEIIEIDQKSFVDKQSMFEEDYEVKDYMAKDFESFRSALLQLVSNKLPDWHYKSESDTRLVLLDIFSYVADELSYYQDRVANEAFLNTSTKKFSASSHLQLLDYKLHNGCSATAFIKINVNEKGFIPQGFDISNKVDVSENQIVFESDEGYKLTPRHNKISLVLHENQILPKGSNTAYLDSNSIDIKKGHYILFEQNHMKQIVKLTKEPQLLSYSEIFSETSEINKNDSILKITWGMEDSLKFDCHSSALVSANVIKTTEGQTIGKKEILKTGNDVVADFRFKLKQTGLVFTSNATNSTSSLKIWVDDESWEEVDDLLNCEPFDKCFTVEIDDDGFAEIKFGNGKYGKKPFPWSTIEAKYRIGIGKGGNLGENILTTFDLEKYPFIDNLTNPLPAFGGIESESLFEEKMIGLKQLGIQERAVTPNDYSNLIKNKFSRINNVKTRFVYTGSWNAIKISVDLPKTLRNKDVLNEVHDYVDQIKMIGNEVLIEFADYVYPDIKLTLYLESGYGSKDVEYRINLILGNQKNSNGTKGFFHPDNFSFGTPVYVSKLFEAIEQIPGIDYIVINSFRKFSSDLIKTTDSDILTKRNLKQGFIPIADHQILRLENDPNHPEYGRLVITFVERLARGEKDID